MAPLPGQVDAEFAADEVRTLAHRLERDRREPDKVLTYVLDLRRLATELEHRAQLERCPGCGALMFNSASCVDCITDREAR
jgi:hypothetical protein